MLSDYFSLAFKNLKKRGIRSWLTLLGIFIGITIVVALISLGQGLRTGITSQFGTASTELITIQAGGVTGFGPPGSGVVNPLTEQDVEDIERLDTVERAIGLIIPSIKVEYKDEQIISFAISVPSGENRDFYYDLSELEIEKGRLLEDGDTNKILLGHNFYSGTGGFSKKIEPGDTITISDRDFRVVGILERAGSFITDGGIYINQDYLQDLIGNGDEVDVIDAKVKNKDLIDKAKEDIEEVLRKNRDVDKGEEDFTVQTPEAALRTVNQILGGVQVFVVMIASISIIVGAIGIVNTMTTSVLERKREIGIMKAIGAKNSDIFLQFFIEAGLLGLVGGIAGIILGASIGYLGTLALNNFLGVISRPQIDIILITSALAGSFIIGSISGIAPAIKAARQDPVKALRT